MKKTFLTILTSLTLLTLTSCHPNGELDVYQQTTEYCCSENTCQGYEYWDSSYEREDDTIVVIQTKGHEHVEVTRVYHR